MVTVAVRIPRAMKDDIEEAVSIYNRKRPGQHSISSVIRFAVNNLFHPGATQMGMDAQDDER